MKTHKDQWLLAMPYPPERLPGSIRRGHTMAPVGQTPSQWLCLMHSPRKMCSQPIVSKALAWGIIRQSACLLAAITIRKSQEPCSEPIPEVFAPWVHCTSRPHPSSGRECCCDFYILPKAQICMAVSSLLQNERWYQRRHDGAELVVECKPQFLTNPAYRSALQGLVESEECRSILPS
jgi:hypothetical protein